MNVTLSRIIAVAVILTLLGAVLDLVVKDDKQASNAPGVESTKSASATSSASGDDSTSDPNSDNYEPLTMLPPSRQELAPDFSIKSTTGHTFKLSEAVKHGPVLIDFWATYCGPCRQELPEYEEAYKEYKAKGVQFVTINSSDTMGDIKSFASTSGLTMPMLSDSDGSVAGAYGVDAIPVTLVIDRNRKCVAASTGYAIGAIKQNLPGTLDALLSQKS